MLFTAGLLAGNVALRASVFGAFAWPRTEHAFELQVMVMVLSFDMEHLSEWDVLGSSIEAEIVERFCDVGWSMIEWMEIEVRLMLTHEGYETSLYTSRPTDHSWRALQAGNIQLSEFRCNHEKKLAQVVFFVYLCRKGFDCLLGSWAST
jgi:hypothetical protein